MEFIELEFASGLKQVVERELEKLLQIKKEILFADDGIILLPSTVPVKQLFSLRSIANVYSLISFPVPRPRGLLKDEYLQILGESIRKARVHLGDKCETFRLSMAGKESSVAQNIINSLCRVSGMPYAEEGGDLLIKIRPSILEEGCWEVAIRQNLRPLSVRSWRVANLPGALDSCLAYACATLIPIADAPNVLDITCGSGTFLIERALLGEYKQLCGIDIAPRHIKLAKENAEAASTRNIDWLTGDACTMEIPYSNFDLVFSNLPWGERVGSRRDNLDLYQGLLAAACRFANKDGTIIFISQDDVSLDEALAQNTACYMQRKFQVGQSGFHPWVYVCKPMTTT